MVERSLKIINTNMMNCPKNEVLEQIMDKINLVMDHNIRGTQSSVALSGAINKWTLKLNDLNKEAEFQSSQNTREIGPIKVHFLAFSVTTFAIAILGIIGEGMYEELEILSASTNFYFGLAFLNVVCFYAMGPFVQYLNNFTVVYSIILVILQAVMIKELNYLHPDAITYNLLFISLINF